MTDPIQGMKLVINRPHECCGSVMLIKPNMNVQGAVIKI